MGIDSQPCPRTLLEKFWLLNLLQITSAGKHTLKNRQNVLAYPPKIIVNAPLAWTHFQKKAYLRPLAGLISLHLANTQPDLKLHLPTKIF